eukprot:1966884-Amphidinium_carterae.1
MGRSGSKISSFVKLSQSCWAPWEYVQGSQPTPKPGSIGTSSSIRVALPTRLVEALQRGIWSGHDMRR